MKRLDYPAEIRKFVGADLPEYTDDDAAAEVDAYLAEIRAERWGRLVPALYVDATIDTIPAEYSDLAAWADRVAAGDPANGLILGPVGAGKTWSAWAALRRCHDLGVDVRGTTAADLLECLRPDGPGATRLVEAGVLLIDDIAAERKTEWTADQMARVIDDRHRHRRPTLITSNLDPTALETWLGERTYSRLAGGAVAWWFDGPDRRRTT